MKTGKIPNRQRSASNDKINGDDASISKAAEVNETFRFIFEYSFRLQTNSTLLEKYFQNSLYWIDICRWIQLIISIITFSELSCILARTIFDCNANWSWKWSEERQKQQFRHKRNSKFSFIRSHFLKQLFDRYVDQQTYYQFVYSIPFSIT